MTVLRRAVPGAALLVAAILVAACQARPPAELAPLAQPDSLQPAAARINSAIAAGRGPQREFVSPGRGEMPALRRPARSAVAGQPGDVTLNFVDTDIREIARTILGVMLRLNYTIDPNVRGTATIEIAEPLPAPALLPVLETLLNQNGATLVERNGIYAVVPTAAGALANPIVGVGGIGSGTQVIALRYASARDLAKLLEPYVAEGGKITPDAARNALIVAGDASVRRTLIELVRAFDIDVLAGQSYALFPAGNDRPGRIAGELERVLGADPQGAAAGTVRVMPMERINAVLVVSSQPRHIDAARRFFRLAERVGETTARSWHVYYVQNGQSADLENMLQRAFTPDHVTPAGGAAPAAATPPATIRAGRAPGSGGLSGAARAGGGPSPPPAEPAAATGLAGPIASTGGAPGGLSPEAMAAATQLLSGDIPGGREASRDSENRIRIIANRRNNALLIHATPSEYSVIEGMLRKIDIIPLQVLIEATIAEVTLNDALSYGTQFFLGRKLAATLSNSPRVAPNPLDPLASPFNPAGALAANFPGFVLNYGARAAISALSEVTELKVLSAPQIMVLDNEPARLSVGRQVPIITGTAQSVLAAGAPIVNSVDYHETGVIMQVTPRVNSGGLVTLDIAQEVSDVAPTTSSTINSPTFDDRSIRTRVAVQDGQTVGLAGLIKDTDSQGNSGIPLLKDIPILSLLTSTQGNARQRTELLVLITPHVVRDQRDARALTEDLRRQLIRAGTVPQQLNSKPAAGSPNPMAP